MGKEEVKLSQFADDMILHIENPKDATRKLLELINEFGSIFRILYVDRKSTRLNSSHITISYAVFCLKKKRNSNWKRRSKAVTVCR